MTFASDGTAETELVSDLELRIAIKTAADTAENLGYGQIRALLTMAFLTLDDLIATKQREMNHREIPARPDRQPIDLGRAKRSHDAQNNVVSFFPPPTAQEVLERAAELRLADVLHPNAGFAEAARMLEQNAVALGAVPYERPAELQ